MSTRANIKVTDSFGDELWFYQHSDGYPEGAMPLLNEFISRVRSGLYRDNANQSAGWLVIMGREQMLAGHEVFKTIWGKPVAGYDWKVGDIEPTAGQHADIEYLYHIDLEKKDISIISLVPFGE